ncbi:hypothetical protein LCGC14_2756630, partial [marine sediment metagenome]
MAYGQFEQFIRNLTRVMASVNTKLQRDLTMRSRVARRFSMTEAAEFWKIYKLDVIAVPTNRKLQRLNHHDVIYRTVQEKYVALADEIERVYKWDVVVTKKNEEIWGKIVREYDEAVELTPKGSKQRETIPRDQILDIEYRGRPILVGTVSIERSELISSLLEKRGVKHEVLNAKHHKREAEIVAQAGRKNAITIATNMAGRGTDIKLGQGVTEMGGLHIICTELHDSARIDRQLSAVS